jgi:hypothetical protein
VDGAVHISEAARWLGVTPHHLRVLEWEGRIPAAPEEVRAMDAEIIKIEEEMRAEGIDPYPKPDKTQTNSAGHPKLSLDEHRAMLEEEIGGCQED